MARFAAGDRVVVKIDGNGLDGYYGHVKGRMGPDDLVPVVLEGRTGAEADVQLLGDLSLCFLPDEIEHAD